MRLPVSGWPRRAGWGVVLAVVLSLIVGVLMVRADIAQRRDAFQTEARAAHRLLSQRMAQNEAILATLVLGARQDPQGSFDLAMPTGFPHLVAARRAAVPADSQDATGAANPRLVGWDPAGGRYDVVMHHQGYAYGLHVDVRRLLDDPGWPWAAGDTADAPFKASLWLGDTELVLHAASESADKPAGLTEGFRFAQSLGSLVQPFEFRAQRWTGPAEWPWARLALAAGLCSLLVFAAWLTLAQREERQRAAESKRLAQTARLNTLGELAAGMAHELNQPLTAVLSGTQAALRLLKEAPPAARADDVVEALPALELAAAQARRAAEVVSRLRASVKPREVGPVSQRVDLPDLVGTLLHVLAPELRQHRVHVSVSGAARVLADRVALEQVLHNLLVNALQALAMSQRPDPRIQVTIRAGQGGVDCTVEDNGPGMSRDNLQRVFEPFFTTRAEGLGLGLSLCQTLVQSMGGQLTADSDVGRGARFCVHLPAA